MKTILTLGFYLFSLTSFAHHATVLDIITLGHPTLRAKAQEVAMASFEDREFQQLVDDMIETMKKKQGVGLAAPQVNQSIRMFVMKSSLPNIPLTVVINPKMEYLEEFGKKDSSEGCLSIPGRTLTVPRYKKVHLSYFNRKGEYIAEELSGFKAIVAQHEYDHLNGVLIVDLVDLMFSKYDMEAWLKAPKM